MNTATLIPPTDSPSLNGALLALCRVTYRNDYSDAQFNDVAAKILTNYEPTVDGAALDLTDLLEAFESLSSDEFLNLAGVDVVSADRGQPWG